MTLHGFTVKQFGMQRWQQRVQLQVDRLLDIEEISRRLGGKASGIQKAFECWRDKRRHGRVGLDDYDWLPADDVVTTHIDVSPENPFHYRFTSHHLKYFPWMTGRRLADFPHREIVRACGVEYVSCKANGEPVAHHITHDLNGFRREYVRLLLPLTSPAGDVSALVCVSRHLDSPAPDESHSTTLGDWTKRVVRHPPGASRGGRP